MENTIDRPKLTNFLTQVRQEIANMQSGESKYRNGALHLEKNTCPALNKLNMFENNPTTKGLQEFLALAAQDWGIQAATAFTTWSRDIFALTPEEEKVKVVKNFDTLIKDHIYDFFKTVNTPMTPRQVELLEKHSSQFAHTIKTEVSKEIIKQIKALVEQMKKDEAKDND